MFDGRVHRVAKTLQATVLEVVLLDYECDRGEHVRVVERCLEEIAGVAGVEWRTF